MTRRIIFAAFAILLVLSMAFVATSDAGDVTKCDKKVKKTATGKVGCSGMKGADKSANVKCNVKCKAEAYCGKAAKACGEKCGKGCCAKAKRAAHTSALKKVADNIPYRESKRIVVTGEVLCGKCTEIGEMATCQPMVKTSDGKLYPLVKNGVVKKLRACHSENKYKISGRVKKIQGVKYLDVTSVKDM